MWKIWKFFNGGLLYDDFALDSDDCTRFSNFENFVQKQTENAHGSNISNAALVQKKVNKVVSQSKW
jgi:hypothetical protein